MEYSHACFGSRLNIVIFSGEHVSEKITECFTMADIFEQKYSRFIDGNFLSQLNHTKHAQIDHEFLSLVKLCIQVSKITQGYFDITLLPVLENLGYGILSEIQEESLGYENIILGENNIELKNKVSIDIGAVGKGYMVDKIYNTLSEHVDAFMINFGGDIRIKGTQKIELEDPADETKSIGTIMVLNGAIASSAGNKRIFGSSHHLINAKTKKSQNDKIALYVTHKIASFADIFSTALFVCPLELSLKILQQTKGLEALIISREGTIYKSRGFDCILHTQAIGQ